MKRPWQVWVVFAVCVLGVAAGMAWLTQQALRTDERRRAAEAETELEQRVSLAVWRMDTELAPILAAEVVRPPSDFRPLAGAAAELPPFVVLQCEATPTGQWHSPQQSAKQPASLERLHELAEAVDLPKLIAQLPKTPLPSVAEVQQQQEAANAVAKNGGSEPESASLFEGNTINQAAERSATQSQVPDVPQQAANSKPTTKEADFEQRGKRYQSATQQNLLSASRAGTSANLGAANAPAQNKGVHPFRGLATEQVGVSRPVWIGDRLLLARRVSENGRTYVQGSWLDWPKLKAHLLAEAADVLPKADLVPVTSANAESDPSRMLAGLPVRLVIGESVQPGVVGPTLRWALQIGWGAVILAVVAAAFLLAGVMTLSERRAAFVSSVTHELRTPLTTFRMYAEMLARGMVPDATRRQEYFETLQRESERLTLLVENVLAYARLERGRKPQAQDRVTVESLFERIGPRLKQRAAQAEMECVVCLPLLSGESSNTEFTTDQAVIEQILFNLVDNAAKYARDATDRRIHVEASGDGQFVQLTVRDHGPGIKNGLWSRQMQPFGKSAQDSAESAPGVGLGLALCRRLAQELGGRLEITAAPDNGAAVSLILAAR